MTDEDYDKTFAKLDAVAGDTPTEVCRVMLRMKDEIDHLRTELKEIQEHHGLKYYVGRIENLQARNEVLEARVKELEVVMNGDIHCMEALRMENETLRVKLEKKDEKCGGCLGMTLAHTCYEGQRTEIETLQLRVKELEADQERRNIFWARLARDKEGR